MPSIRLLHLCRLGLLAALVGLAPLTLAETAPQAAVAEAVSTNPEPAATLPAALAGSNFAAKKAALEQIAAEKPPYLADLFAALAEGQLYGNGSTLWLKEAAAERYAPLDAPEQWDGKPADAKKNRDQQQHPPMAENPCSPKRLGQP